MRAYRNQDWLYQKYVAEKKSPLEIGQLACCTCPTIFRYLKLFGIPQRSRSEAAQIRHNKKQAIYKNKEWLIAQYVNAGNSMEEVARLAGTSPSRIDYWFTKHSVPRRSRKGLGHKLWENPSYRNNQIEVKRQSATDPTKKQQFSIMAKQYWEKLARENKRDEFIKKRAYARTPEHGQKISASLKGRIFSDIHKKHISESQRKLNEEHPGRMINLILAASNKRPTLPEQLLDKMTPVDVRYVGNKQWWRKLGDGHFHNPDFKVTGQNKVIEVFGDYWHRNDNPNDLIDLYKNVGLDCLVIWESEIKKQPGLVQEKVNHFLSV